MVKYCVYKPVFLYKSLLNLQNKNTLLQHKVYIGVSKFANKTNCNFKAVVYQLLPVENLIVLLYNNNDYYICNNE